MILGRRRFGTQGWSRFYGFNLGDLVICANVLSNYLNASANGPAVPWQDLRYIFGEIMYGGHITDYWDRRTNNTYLEVRRLQASEHMPQDSLIDLVLLPPLGRCCSTRAF